MHHDRETRDMSWAHESSFAAATSCAVLLQDVTKQYGKGQETVVALDRVSAAIASGTFTSVMGPSGSGKSTFLHCAAGLDRPSSGTVRLGSSDLSQMKEAKLTRLRRSRVGFVFQAFNLLPSLTIEQNITLPLRLAGKGADRGWLHHIVSQVGIADRLSHFPGELSGGQQQRAAIARALITRPEVVFADEPTGALDPETARDVLGLLRRAVSDMHQTVVMVTHDPVAATFTDQALFLADGRIAGQLDSPSVEQVSDTMSCLRRAA
jgi:putative ABC transport system ATP-binding protein